MPDYCVLVTFEILPEHAEVFHDLVRRQARESLTEAGCRVFDVWTDPDKPDQLMLYEIYDGAEAFRSHLATPHFQRFDEESAPMIRKKSVTTWATRMDVDG